MLQLQHQYHLVMVLWYLSQLYFLLKLMTAFYCFCWLLPNLATLLMIFPIPFALLDLSSIFIESVISLITFPNLISFPLTLIIFFKGLQPLFLIQLLQQFVETLKFFLYQVSTPLLIHQLLIQNQLIMNISSLELLLSPLLSFMQVLFFQFIELSFFLPCMVLVLIRVFKHLMFYQ